MGSLLEMLLLQEDVPALSSAPAAAQRLCVQADGPAWQGQPRDVPGPTSQSWVRPQPAGSPASRVLGVLLRPRPRAGSRHPVSPGWRRGLCPPPRRVRPKPQQLALVGDLLGPLLGGG